MVRKIITHIRMAGSYIVWFTISLVIGGVLHAQVLEEVIVIAQKREQALSDVGIAVTAFTGDQIEALGFETSTEIVAMSPGVYISADTGGQNRKFTIRGVTQNDFLDAVEAPIAVYVDEAYISTQQGQVFGLFDMERIEILRGPQGTLFGRNATGGLVHYITRKPSFDENTGFTKVTFGSYNQIRLETALGGSLSENIAGRAAFMYNKHDGILKNSFPQGALSLDPNPTARDDLENDDSWGVRGHLLFNLSEKAELLLSGYASRSEIGPGAYEAGAIVAVLDAQGRHINTIVASPTETREMIGPGGVAVPIIGLDFELPVEFGLPAPPEDATRPVPGGDVFGYRDDDLGDFRGSIDWADDDVNQYETYGMTAKLSWELSGSLALTSVTDFKVYDKIVSLDVDAGPVSQFMFMADAETNTFAQELRLNMESSRTRWVAGVYYLYIDNETLTGLPFLDESFLSFGTPPFGLDMDPFDGIPGPGVDYITEVALQTNSYSIFGQVDYDLNDTLTLIAGARVILEEKKYFFSQTAYANVNDRRLDTEIFGFVLPHQAGANPFSDKSSDTLWAAKIQLEWKPNNNWLVYGGINRGVKAGSFNGPLPDLSQIAAADIPYDEEVLLAYEIGFKSTIFDGKARLNGSAYYYDYSDYQAFTFTNVSGIITNEDATMKGFEVDIAATPVDGLDLLFAYSYIDAKVDNVEVAPGIFRDVEPTFTPKTQFSGLIRYSWPIANGSELAIQLDGNYASKRFANLRNFDAHIMGSFVVGNARLFWESPNRVWWASLFVTNIGDERVLTERFDLATLCGCEDQHFAKPRWYGGSVRFNF